MKSILPNRGGRSTSFPNLNRHAFAGKLPLEHPEKPGNVKRSRNFLAPFAMLFIAFFGLVHMSHSQVNPGEIAVIQYDADNPDRFTIVTLVDLTAGTVFHFTDNGFTSPTAGRTGENFLSFTVPAGGYTKGQTFTWTNGMSIAGTPWSSSAPTNFSFNASGDQLFCFTGNTGNWASQSGITLISGFTTSAFITSGSADASTSYNPSGLSDSFVTTITAENGYFANGTSSQATVTVSGTVAQLQALIFDGPTKWFRNATGPLTMPAYSITVTNSSPTISATGNFSAMNTTYGTASAASSISVSGTNLTNNIVITPPAGFEVSKTAGGASGYAATQTLTQSGGTVAATTIYVRLAATTTFGNYSGNVALVSSPATTINKAIPSSAVGKKGLTVSGATASDKEYDGNTTATITGATAVGTVNGDAITLDGNGTFADENVGNNKSVTAALTFSGTNSGSYTLTQPTGLQADITAKSLTLSASVGNKVYDGNTSASISGTLNGVVSPDDVQVNFSGNFASPFPASAIGVTSTSVLFGADAGNYVLIQPAGLAADITEKSLTILNASALNKVFDGNTDAVITGTLSGAISGEDVDFEGTGTFASSAVGINIPVTATATLIGADATNYTLVQPTGLAANISAEALDPQEITFDPMAAVVYGDSPFDPGATASSGLTVTYSSSDTNVATASGNIVTIVGVGTATITAFQSGDLTYDAAMPVDQVLTVLPKELTVSAATASDKVYDGNDAAVISGVLSGVVGSDDVTLDGTGLFLSVFAANDIEVFSTSTLSGTDAANYTLAQPTVLAADITPKALTVDNAIAGNKPYDGTTDATISGATLNGIIGSDDVSVSGNGIFASAGVANDIAVTANLSLSGGSASNYSIIQPTGLSADITPLALTVTGIAAENKVYDQATAASVSGTASPVGVIGSDDVSIAGTPTATFNNKNAGNTKPVSVTGYTLAGADAGNYTLALPVVLSADIAPASVTISGAEAQDKTFDGNTNAVIIGTLSGVISPDAVTLIGTGTFASSAVGNNIAVTATATLGGADGGNYVINPQPTGLSANILAAPVVLANWTYEPQQGAVATPTPNVGTGSASLVGSMTGAGTATGMNGSGCGGQVSGQTAWAIGTAAPGSTNESSGARFNTSTAGYRNITFSWDQRSSNTAANTMRVQYTLNGSAWTNFEMTASNTTFCLGSLNNGRFENSTAGDQFRRVTVDFSAITGANNNPNFGVRVVAAHYQNTGQFRQTQTPSSVATGGTWRFDNVRFTGMEMPLNPPTASVISGTATICQGESANISVAITDGTSPYTVVYTDGNANFTVNNYVSGSDISVSPATSATFTIVSVTDANALVGTGNSGSAVIAVNIPTTYYADSDSDGFGNPAVTQSACGAAPIGFVADNTDCNDSDTNVYQLVPLYADADQDGYGAGTLQSICAGNTTPAGYSLNNLDCDDTKNAVHPNATEIGYNLIDDDCDGSADEGFTPITTVIQGPMCNTTLAAIDSQIMANIVANSQGYRWRITTMTGPAAGQIQTLDTNIRAMKLTQLVNYAFNTQYKVELSVRYAGFWQPFTASNCTVITPAATTQLSACGQTLTNLSDPVYANIVPYAAGYRFRITDPLNGANTQVLERPIRDVKMSMVTNFVVQYGKTYNVEVAVKNTDGTYLPYGNICQVTTPVFPTTSLQDAQCDNYEVPTNATQVYALSYPGAIAYGFQLSGGGLPAPVEVIKNIRTFTLNDFAGQLQPGATYNVKVRLIFNVADPAGPYGKTCSIVTPGLSRPSVATVGGFNAVVFPNPFSESFSIEVTASQKTSVNVKVYDMTGRLLDDKTVDAADIASLNAGESYPSGVYNVIVTQGDNVKTLRVVKR